MVRLFEAEEQSTTKISCNYSIIKILVALGQMILATATLYRTRGSQIDRFGYAAFGLTVTPYAFMSFINSIAHLVCPEYPAIFLVGSEALRDLRGRAKYSSENAMKDATILETAAGTYPLGNLKMGIIYWGILPVASLIPLTIIGCLSGFHSGSSTLSQGVWTMAWHAQGIFWSLFSLAVTRAGPAIITSIRGKVWTGIKGIGKILLMLILLTILGVSAIGGCITVGQMIKEYGVCIQIYS
ncbi:hypothetical protein AOQ84DRAFT_299587 [Glonium stellatum]|uniref:Uncharacterized protein n=1 Tax=Glonium stellatum TaxID=574774 RepID=A0A8E2JPP9_9PEZI|nr:hypothetical protein AOQ84DRAFT_299587 [Glonium stellatum]